MTTQQQSGKGYHMHALRYLLTAVAAVSILALTFVYLVAGVVVVPPPWKCGNQKYNDVFHSLLYTPTEWKIVYGNNWVENKHTGTIIFERMGDVEMHAPGDNITGVPLPMSYSCRYEMQKSFKEWRRLFVFNQKLV